jgi:hypothetical protein
MPAILQPWQLLWAGLAGWFNQGQQNAIEYQRAEIETLRELLGPKRLLLNDDQRRRLAVKAKTLGRQALEDIGALFTPDTLLRWHRRLVAAKSWRSAGEAAAPFTELERPLGAVHALHQGRVPGADDLLRRKVLAQCHP